LLETPDSLGQKCREMQEDINYLSPHCYNPKSRSITYLLFLSDPRLREDDEGETKDDKYKEGDTRMTKGDKDNE